MFQHLSVQPKAPSQLNRRLVPALDVVLLRALAKRPEERFPSVSAFATAFRQALTYDVSTATLLLLNPNPHVTSTAYANIEPTVAAMLPQSNITPFAGFFSCKSCGVTPALHHRNTSGCGDHSWRDRLFQRSFGKIYARSSYKCQRRITSCNSWLNKSHPCLDDNKYIFLTNRKHPILNDGKHARANDDPLSCIQ